MTIVFYISGHGWGHASRSIELLNAIATRAPDACLVARTGVPSRLFRTSAHAPVEVQPVETDSGVAQIDSLHIDEDATAAAAALFYRDFDRTVDVEREALERLGASMVVGDIPPLAFAAAARAGVPSIAVGNFTWDWIYGGYPAFTRIAPEVCPVIREAYARATRALRLPMHGGFEPMARVVRDIPFIARRSGRDPADTRRQMGVGGKGRIVLASFGGYGLDLPHRSIERTNGLTILADPDLPGELRYEDLVAAADVVVGKPGYGIVSECIANRTPLLYTSRGRFVEYDVMVAEMPRVLRCRYIPQEDLRAGRWSEAIEALLAQPMPPETPRVDGADVAAGEILGEGSIA